MNKYEIIIFWSEADKVFIAEMPELKGCMAHGNTPEEALRQVYVVSQEWLKLATEKGWDIPQPKGKLMFA